MEVREFIRGALSQSWIVALVTLLAVGAAYAAVRGTKDSYLGTVSITVPAADAQTAGANGQYLANFQAAITSTSVLDAVAHDTGETTDALAAGLSTNQVGNSSFISVSYLNPDASRAETVARAAAVRTANLLAAPGIAGQQAILDNAQSALDDATAAAQSAQAALDAFIKVHGRVDSLLQTAQGLLSNLTVALLNQQASGRVAPGFAGRIAETQADADRLQPLVTQYDALERAANAAGVTKDGAAARVATAKGDVVLAQTPPMVQDATHTLQSRTTVIVKTVAIAAGLAFALGVALVLLLQFLVATGRRTTNRAPTASPAG